MENFQAAKRINGGKGVAYKQFKKNQLFTAYPDNQAGLPSNVLKVFKTPDGYMIPMHGIQILGPIGPNPSQRSSNASGHIEDAQIIEATDYYNKEQLNTAGTLFKKSAGGSKILELTRQRSKAAINTAMAGAALGFVYAMAKQKNKWLFITFGAVGGFILGNAYNNFISDDNKKSAQKTR